MTTYILAYCAAALCTLLLIINIERMYGNKPESNSYREWQSILWGSVLWPITLVGVILINTEIVANYMRFAEWMRCEFEILTKERDWK